MARAVPVRRMCSCNSDMDSTIWSELNPGGLSPQERPSDLSRLRIKPLLVGWVMLIAQAGTVPELYHGG